MNVLIDENRRFYDKYTGEDITDEFRKLLVEGVTLGRLKAKAAMLEAARIAKKHKHKSIMRNEKGVALGERKASIAPAYYHAVIHARHQENSYLKENNINPWDDPEFLEHELKENPMLKPEADKETRFYQHSQKSVSTAPIFNPSFNINDSKYDL